MTPSVSPGTRVFDVFHRLVGRVTDVEADVAFGVLLMSGEEVWLGREVLFTAEASGVTLVCNGTQLDAYRYPSPTIS